MAEFRKISWSEVNLEILSEKLSRKYISSERMTIARIELKKGSVVPEHQHEHEQLSWVLEGELQIELNGSTVRVRGGEILVIPPNIPHKATAIEDTVDMDIFSPVRTDWASGDDSYLRGSSTRIP